MSPLPINPHDSHPRRQVEAAGVEMHFVDTGAGEPVVLLHGNPASSYIWRNIIPYLDERWRCLAPDLAGMGASGPAPGRACRFVDHVRYLDAWFDTVLPSQRVALVLHDWGSALGFHWARRHAERVRAIAYMEAIVQPRLWSDFLPAREPLFRALRGEDGERLVLDDNFFVETVLPHSILRTLSAQEMAAYRAPFLERERRRTMLAWARELPVEGEPGDVVAIVEAYGAWLAASEIPKLIVSATPGSLLVGRALAFARTWPNQRELQVEGVHYLQEDAPDEIGAALREFMQALPA